MDHTDKQEQPTDDQEDLMQNSEEEFNTEDYVSAADELDSDNEQSSEGTAAEEIMTDDQNVIILSKQLEQTKEQMMRALADAENTRRRAVKERDDARKYAVADFAKDLLDFSDNFGRALEAFPEDLKTNDKIGGVVTGIEAMEKDLLKTFEKHGIQKIEPMDEVFNPNFHEVMFEAPMPDKPAGTIIQIIEPGYMLGDRLLRPARVGVVKDDGQGGPNDAGINQTA